MYPVVRNCVPSIATAVCLGTLLCASAAHPAMDPRFELDPRGLAVTKSIAPPQEKKEKRRHRKRTRKEAAPHARSTLNLESPLVALSEQELVVRAHEMWNRIVPSQSEQQKPLAFETAAFSLTLDPERFPTFARIDGGRILLDRYGNIPPLVRSLIDEKDPSVRIVADVPSGTKSFMASLLEAGGFYSVEENFSMEFGTDPKLTVQADFKVEKTAESLMKQDIVLVNSGYTPFPAPLTELLKKEGFSLHEPFASRRPSLPPQSRIIHIISATKPPEMIDSILAAFSVVPERDRRVDVFAADDNGISLSVTAERYFERDGQRYVVAGFNGDPILYTLLRILETKGYRVVMFDAKDDFRRISEKLTSRMNIKAVFGQQDLFQDLSAGYSLRMSGFKLEDPWLPAGGNFLTDRVMDPVVRDLCAAQGLAVNDR